MGGVDQDCAVLSIGKMAYHAIVIRAESPTISVSWLVCQHGGLDRPVSGLDLPSCRLTSEFWVTPTRPGGRARHCAVLAGGLWPGGGGVGFGPGGPPRRMAHFFYKKNIQNSRCRGYRRRPGEVGGRRSGGTILRSDGSGHCAVAPGGGVARKFDGRPIERQSSAPAGRSRERPWRGRWWAFGRGALGYGAGGFRALAPGAGPARGHRRESPGRSGPRLHTAQC